MSQTSAGAGRTASAEHARAEAAAVPARVTGHIGATPLVRLTRVAGPSAGVPEGVEVYAKAEHMNPGGSVKDRAALGMIVEGERSGALTPGKTILDATSGNTRIAYAMIGAALGYRVAVCLPKNASPERKRILKIYGWCGRRWRSTTRAKKSTRLRRRSTTSRADGR